MDLSFLHPVTELIITIRKKSEMTDSLDTTAALTDEDQGAKEKNWFAYHGSGSNANVDSLFNKLATPGDEPYDRSRIRGGDEIYQDGEDNIRTTNFKLKLNGQERHTSTKGLSRDYLIERLMPMLHSGSAHAFEHHEQSVYSGIDNGHHKEFKQLSKQLGRKEIYALPFSINPEGANPSGAVNFSKVTHAKLEIYGLSRKSGVEYQVDVYGVYYNWLQIKDGRALVTFA